MGFKIVKRIGLLAVGYDWFNIHHHCFRVDDFIDGFRFILSHPLPFLFPMFSPSNSLQDLVCQVLSNHNGFCLGLWLNGAFSLWILLMEAARIQRYIVISLESNQTFDVFCTTKVSLIYFVFDLSCGYLLLCLFALSLCSFVDCYVLFYINSIMKSQLH